MFMILRTGFKAKEGRGMPARDGKPTAGPPQGDDGI